MKRLLLTEIYRRSKPDGENDSRSFQKSGFVIDYNVEHTVWKRETKRD